jgi:hypothetical protein
MINVKDCLLAFNKGFAMVDFKMHTRNRPPNIRPEIQALIDRGSVTLAEHNALQCNSWEWEALVPVLTTEALIATTEHAIKNCVRARSPALTYDEAVHSVYAPELIKRLRAARASPCSCGEHGTDTPCPYPTSGGNGFLCEGCGQDLCACPTETENR